MKFSQQRILYFRLLRAFTIYRIIAMTTAGVALHRNWKLLENEKCGNSNTDRIIGGRNAGIGWYPWIARIGYSGSAYLEEDELEYRCGGSLINELYVITAAHCVSNLPSRLKVAGVRLGEHNTATDPDCEDSYCAEPVQDFEPASIIVHRNYNNPLFRNDIAMIRLNRPANLNDFVMPICMPGGELLTKDFLGTTAEVAGWGIYDMADPKPSVILQTVKLPIVETAACRRIFTDYVRISDQQICVGGIEGEDSCAGDSGGPLMKVVALDGPPKYFLIGIVSFGVMHCGSLAKPAIYTKVSHYITWVLDNVEP